MKRFLLLTPILMLLTALAPSCEKLDDINTFLWGTDSYRILQPTVGHQDHLEKLDGMPGYVVDFDIDHHDIHFTGYFSDACLGGETDLAGPDGGRYYLFELIDPNCTYSSYSPGHGVEAGTIDLYQAYSPDGSLRFRFNQKDRTLLNGSFFSSGTLTLRVQDGILTLVIDGQPKGHMFLHTFNGFKLILREKIAFPS